jgi:hypothetical protein
VPGDPKIRASDADRDRVAALLREHHAAGRLNSAEFQDRLDKAMDATTLGELDELMADLPAIDLYELPDVALRRGWHRAGQREVGRDGNKGLPWGPALASSQQGVSPRGEGSVPALSAGATALVAWATVALTLAVIGLVTSVLTGGLPVWWTFAAIPAGAISLIWFVIRRSQR